MKRLAGWSITIMIPTKDDATKRAVMVRCAATTVSFLSLGDYTYVVEETQLARVNHAMTLCCFDGISVTFFSSFFALCYNVYFVQDKRYASIMLE